MQTVALHWHVYLLTHSPLALGLVGLTRVVPIVIFSLWGGIVADRADRRRVMLVAQSAMLVLSAGLALLTYEHRTTLLILYLLNAGLAAASAFDNPARQALVPRLVPPEELPGALALNLTAMHFAQIGGPGLAGLLLGGGLSFFLPRSAAAATSMADTRVVALIYALNAVSFVGVIATLARMKTSGKVEVSGPPEHPIESLKAGLRFVFKTPIMVWTTGLDFLATFFAGSLSLLPVFADQVLHVGAVGYGWLVGAPALGALAGSLYTSVRPLPRHQGRILLASVAAYGVFTVLYGLSGAFTITLLALFGTGLADLVSTVIRQTLRQTLTPDALRGRMTSVNMIFFMGGPQLGELEAGLVASMFATAALGVRVSVVSGGIATVILALVVAAAAPIVRRYTPPLLNAPGAAPRT
jgi:MFS family permease